MPCWIRPTASSVSFPLAAVSHEIRNPLSTILTWAQLGASERLAPKSSGGPSNASSGRPGRSSAQLDDLFQLLNLSHDKLALNLEPFDVVESLKEAVLSISAAAEKGDSMPELEGFEEDTVAVVDRIRLFQVFSNLLGNAIKYTQPAASSGWSSGVSRSGFGSVSPTTARGSIRR